MVFMQICFVAKSQNKSAYTWIIGNNASFAKFDGSNSKPETGSRFTTITPSFPSAFISKSMICDSNNGRLLFATNGMQLFDSANNIMLNGDTLGPSKIYLHNTFPNSSYTQSSLILPKGSSGEFYVFIPTMSNSAYDVCINGVECPFDLFYLNIVNMNANGSLGKVVVKNNPLLEQVEIHKTMMQACRHANGFDWWLLKQGGYKMNELIRFLVTKDSIYGPYYQSFAEPKYSYRDLSGQMCFSSDGKKFASVQGYTNKLFLADFDRCSGELSNPKVYNLPYDSIGHLPLDSQGIKDSIAGGVCFSPNNVFVYISKQFNIYQFEHSVTDSNLAWYRVQHGSDTSWSANEYYDELGVGPDKRIYIGKFAGGFKQMSVIDYPDLKGSACGFCRKCLRVDSALGGVTSPPNVPDFNLGADLSKPCYPLDTPTSTLQSYWVVYPNPAYTILTVKNRKGKKKELYDCIGQMIYETLQDEINVSSFAKGVYFIKCEGETKKVVVE